MDEAGEQLDRSPLRADGFAADDPLHHFQVPDPPQRRPFVELNQRLGQLVQVVHLVALPIYVHERQAP
jgi:hypothetical protein